MQYTYTASGMVKCLSYQEADGMYFGDVIALYRSSDSALIETYE